MKDMTSIEVTLPAETLSALNTIADKAQTSRAEMIRVILADWIGPETLGEREVLRVNKFMRRLR